MAYNLTNLTDADTVGKLIIFANNAAQNMLGGLLVLAIFFILVIATIQRHGFINSILYASAICFVISSILWFIPLVNIIFPLLFLALMGFSLLYSVTVGS